MRDLPVWLAEFVDEVAAGLEPLRGDAPLCCHVHYREASRALPGEWEVTLFPEQQASRISRLADGFTVPILTVDVIGLLPLFDTLNGCRWQTDRLDSEDDLGAHLSIEGECHGHAVWLRICQSPPCLTDSCQRVAESRWN